MKANELRIGNLILFDVKITKANTRNIAYISNSNRLKNGDSIAFKPIPLTEEWLIRFGFSKSKLSLYTILMGNTIFSISPPFKLGEWQCDYVWLYDEYRFTKIKYVHQLQNLYFALIGEELTIK